MRVSVFSTTFVETFFILRRNGRDAIKMYIGLHVKYPLFWPNFNGLEISLHIFEKYSNVMKSRPEGADLFHEHRWTDRHDEADSHFSKFCERA